MRGRRAGSRLLLLALIIGLVPSIGPRAYAGDIGLQSDPSNDVVDFVKHTQNSFRPSTSPFVSPYPTYQRACRPDSLTQAVGLTNCNPVDLRSWRVQTFSSAAGGFSGQSLFGRPIPNDGKITFTMTVGQNVVPRGAPVDKIPVPFDAINYAWYFGTSAQQTAHEVGRQCTGSPNTQDNLIKDDFTVAPAGPASKTGVDVVYTPKTTCPAAATRNDEARGLNTAGNKNALNNRPVVNTPRYVSDGWLAFVEVAMNRGSHGAPRLDGNGTLQCQINPTTGLPWPVCVDYELSLGRYEGYSGVSASNSEKDFDAITKSRISFDVTGSTITATVPWSPTIISAVDGDGFLDDSRSFPWKFGIDGQTNTFIQATATILGLVSVGANTLTDVNAVCTDSTDNMFPDSKEPIRTIGATEGSVNRTIGTTTNSALDSVGLGDPGKDDGLYLHGDGSNETGDCIRGITGLLTILDWNDDGFELRIYPRNPGYLASPTSVRCRYPVSERPLAIVLVASVALNGIDSPKVGGTQNVVYQGSANNWITTDTNPYDRPWRVRVFAGSPSPVLTQTGQTVGNPMPTRIDPLGGVIGTDQSCGYTFWIPGLHYKSSTSPFTM